MRYLLSTFIAAATLAGCTSTGPLQGGVPLSGYERDAALKETASMLGEHYALTGWHKVCPRPDSFEGCKWVDTGVIVADRVVPTSSGSPIIHVRFEDGSDGFMEYITGHAGVSSISIEAWNVEEEKRRQLREAQKRRIFCVATLPTIAVIGMTTRQILRYACDPEKINSTTTGDHLSEQWVYESGTYLYFRDGKLTAIQSSR
jgi:hypothetical protein